MLGRVNSNRIVNSLLEDSFEIDTLAGLLTLLINQNPTYNKIWVCGGLEDFKVLLTHHLFNKFYNTIYLIRTTSSFITCQIYLDQRELDGLIVNPDPPSIDQLKRWSSIVQSVLDVIFPVYSLRLFLNTDKIGEGISGIFSLTLARRLAKRNWYLTRDHLLRIPSRKEGSLYFLSSQSIPDYLMKNLKEPDKYLKLLSFPLGDWPERLGIRLLSEVPRDRLPYYLGIWPIFWSPTMVAIPADIFRNKGYSNTIWMDLKKFNLTYSTIQAINSIEYSIITGLKRDLDRWLISLMSSTTESKLDSGCFQPLATYFLLYLAMRLRRNALR